MDRDRDRRGQGVLFRSRHARRRRFGGRLRGNLLGEADDQLLRERLGDLQAGHRRGERILPGLRTHARHVVRFRHRERPGRVRVPGSAHRGPDHRRRDPAPATTVVAARDGVAADRRTHRRGTRRRRSVSSVGSSRPTNCWTRRAASPSVCSRVHRSRNARPRRLPFVRNTSRCSRRSVSARRCGRSRAQPRTRPKACAPRPTTEPRNGRPARRGASETPILWR